MIELTFNVFISVLGFLISAFSLFYSHINSAKKMEHRLTAIEYNLKYKLEPLWDAIRGEIPKLLIRDDTPKLDEFLKLVSNGLDDMTDEQVHEMVCLLDEEHIKAIECDDSGRAVGIALFKATLKERHT